MSLGPWKVLTHRDYALIWSASMFSDLGTWMQIAALGIFVAESTRQASWTGAVTTITYLTMGLFLPIGGILADRFDRRQVVIIALFFQAGLGLVLAVVFAMHHRGPLLLITLAGVQGVFSASKPALAAMVPDLVPRKLVSQASFLEQISWNVGRAVGPVVAVIVIKLTSFQTVFVVNALTFFLVIGAVWLARVPLHHHVGGEDDSLRSRLQVGWHGLRRNPYCFSATMCAMGNSILLAPFIALIPTMAEFTLHGSKVDTGHLYLGQGIGSAAGAFLLGSIAHRLHVGRTLFLAIILQPFLVIAYAVSPTLAFAIVMIIPLSAVHTGLLASSNAMQQLYAEPAVRGRVLGFSGALYQIAYAAASVVMAMIADSVGLRVALIGGAVLLLATFVVLAISPWQPTRYLLQDESNKPTEPELMTVDEFAT